MKKICFQCLSAFLLLTIAIGCKSDDLDDISSPEVSDENVTEPVKDPQHINPPNILFILGDDIGKDAFPGYDEGSSKPSMPNLERLISEGITFERFYTYPTCSPTRASILTGKYGYDTGITFANQVLEPSETVLQNFINIHSKVSYNTAVIGKWHLAGDDNTFNPEDLGIDYYAGGVGLDITDYYDWTLTEDGMATKTDEYLTTKFTDLGIDWLERQETDRPWFMWMAHFAAHSPFHLPPSFMHNQGNLPDDDASIRENPLPYYMAMMESLDFEIGRLMEAIPKDQMENTIVIFIGDNGTPGQVAQFPFTRSTAKGSLFQGGINCPMVVAGKNIVGPRKTSVTVQSTDLFATIAELAGITLPQYEDSHSFKSVLLDGSEAEVRSFIYTENKADNSEWMLGKGDLKLIQNQAGEEWLFNLRKDPYEKDNLLEGNLSSETMSIKAEMEEDIGMIRK